MTTSEAKEILHSPFLTVVIVALSYVNLTDREEKVLILRHLRGLTQEAAADQMQMSVNGLQNVEKSALKKCATVWETIPFIRRIRDTNK